MTATETSPIVPLFDVVQTDRKLAIISAADFIEKTDGAQIIFI